ncbi:inner membrane CreD family protein [Salmonella enterica]|nr:inner membrane CreD family protein [Salmonella enterica]
MLKSPLLWKMITLGGAMILLLIPLMMVRHTIVERADYRSHVEAAIRQSTSGPQKVVGPLVAIPVTELYTVLEEEKEVQYKRSYLYFWLPDSQWATRNLTLAMSLNLSGTGSFSLVPVGRSSEMTLTSNWPHPNFVGDFLPGKREISGSGFQAQWQTSRFATNLGEQFADAQKVDWDNLPAFSVAVSTPADQYQLTDRATKYAILLITLTFMAFFVFETLTGQRLHPMQYLLVGLSLVMFYLLLLALSEHIGFTPAWIAASLVGALMNSVYLQAVLKGWRNSVLFTLALLALDGVMWGLLRSEDSSLLLGTGVLLLALGGVMFLTRHLDWYSLSCQQRKSLPPVKDDELRLWK